MAAPMEDAGDRTRPSILERILARTREEVAARKRDRPLPSLDGISPARRAGSFTDAIGAPGVGVIAEFKRRSPSAGPLREHPDLQLIVRSYERGGACAVSVLTDGPHFGGSLDDLRAARAACTLPLLRKDFIIDPYQLHEALAAGADAVLLIVAALDHATLASLHAEASDLGLDVLVEVHDAEELRRALDIGPQLVGVNNRDLRDFSVDLERTFQLLEEIPKGVKVISESGISKPADLLRMRENGVSAVLVGESLMRATDPLVALRELRGS
jgi:indole-3-glycerol phosphate synthase